MEIKMLLEGKVKSGLGEASFWIRKAEEGLMKKTGMNLFYGTLNLELEEEYKLGENSDILHKEEYGGIFEVLIKKCKVKGNTAYILRTEKNETGEGDHPLNIIEIVSDINFRKKYELKDGDKILVEVE
jgi:CTP-dependent riboflavin kinase